MMKIFLVLDSGQKIVMTSMLKCLIKFQLHMAMLLHWKIKDAVRWKITSGVEIIEDIVLDAYSLRAVTESKSTRFFLFLHVSMER